MTLAAFVTVEMVRPGVDAATFLGWRKQRERGAALTDLQPPIGDRVRVWHGLPEGDGGRDWDRLTAFKVRDGWGILRHQQDFVNEAGIQDSVDLK